MRKTVLFVVTNGAGLGHLTRGLAVARRLKKMDADIEVVFYTTSLATELIRNEGFLYYFIPPVDQMPGYVKAQGWNEHLKRQLDSILEIHEPTALVFDGGFPYAGMMEEMRKKYQMKTVWIKREGDKTSFASLDPLADLFHLVLVPKEIGDQTPLRYRRNRVYTNPIIYLEDDESLSRHEVHKLFHVREEKKLVYVQLGVGAINNISDQLKGIMDYFKDHEKYHVVFGESIIGSQYTWELENLTTIREYPNSRYFNGFDVAISAAGYNTVHELVYFALPTIFLPNMLTGKDDQKARAERIQDIGGGILLENVGQIQETMLRLEDKYDEYKSNLIRCKFQNGAIQAADQIYQIL